MFAIFTVLFTSTVSVRHGEYLPLETDRNIIVHLQETPDRIYSAFNVRPSDNTYFLTDVIVTRSSLVCGHDNQPIIFKKADAFSTELKYTELTYTVKHIYVDCEEYGGAAVILTNERLLARSYVYKQNFLPLRSENYIMGLGFSDCAPGNKPPKLTGFTKGIGSEYQRGAFFLYIWYNGNGFNDVADICRADFGGPLLSFDHGELLTNNTRVTGMLSHVYTTSYTAWSATSYSYVLELANSQLFRKAIVDLVLENTNLPLYINLNFEYSIDQLFGHFDPTLHPFIMRRAISKITSDTNAIDFIRAVKNNKNLFKNMIFNYLNDDTTFDNHKFTRYFKSLNLLNWENINTQACNFIKTDDFAYDVCDILLHNNIVLFIKHIPENFDKQINNFLKWYKKIHISLKPFIIRELIMFISSTEQASEISLAFSEDHDSILSEFLYGDTFNNIDLYKDTFNKNLASNLLKSGLVNSNKYSLDKCKIFDHHKSMFALCVSLSLQWVNNLSNVC